MQCVRARVSCVCVVWEELPYTCVCMRMHICATRIQTPQECVNALRGHERGDAWHWPGQAWS